MTIRLRSLEPGTFHNVRLAIEDVATGAQVGTAGFVDGDAVHRRARAYVDVADETYRDDTIRAMCRLGFDAMHLAKIEVDVAADDAAAVAAYERLGFVREVHRRRALWVDGAWRDEYLMGLLAEELS